MSEPPASRLPPRIIQVPPPRTAAVEPVFLLMCPVAIMVLWAEIRVPFGWLGAALPVVWFAMLAAFLAVSARRCARFNRARTHWLQRHESWETDPAAAEIERRWYALSRPPAASAICDAIMRHVVDPPSRAVVAALGAFEIPEPGDHRFEPEVLTPAHIDAMSRVFGVALGLIGLAAIAVGLPFAVRTGPPVAAGALVVGAPCLMVAAGLFWTRLANPTYLRFAPGIVQVITYRRLGRRPCVRSYPIQPGTVCIVAHQLRAVTLTLVRPEQTDRLRIVAAREQRRAAILERLWAAILSTAPTPPLSADELVG